MELDSGIQQQAEQLLRQVGITAKLSDMSFCVLADLLRLYVSSKRYLEVAEKVKQLPASRMLKEIFSEVAKLSISLKGIDINSEDFDKIVSVDLSKRMSGIRLKEEHRIGTMIENILMLRSQQEEGIIFVCGALHAKKLIDEFKKRGLQDEILYYFPHSSRNYDESLDDIDLVMADTLGALVDHTYLLTQNDIKPFSERVIREITEKTRYTKEIPDHNSHSQFLSDCFKTNCRAFLRPGYHVDALVDVTEPSDIEDIQQRVTAVGVQTHHISMDGRNYLAIPNVNTTDIAERIRKIPSL